MDTGNGEAAQKWKKVDFIDISQNDKELCNLYNTENSFSSPIKWMRKKNRLISSGLTAKATIKTSIQDILCTISTWYDSNAKVPPMLWTSTLLFGYCEAQNCKNYIKAIKNTTFCLQLQKKKLYCYIKQWKTKILNVQNNLQVKMHASIQSIQHKSHQITYYQEPSLTSE